MARMSRVARHGVRSVAVAVTPMAVIACLSPLAFGQQLWWDPNGVTSGIGGGGTWNTTSFLWSPDVAGIRLVGAPPASNAVSWNNSGSGTATFAGSSGTVDVVGTVSAAGMVISTSGYRFRGDGVLQLGNPAVLPAGTSLGFINLGTGVTATYSGRLTSTPGTSRTIQLSGAGRLVFDSSNSLVGAVSIRAQNGANIRITHPDAALDGDLDIRDGSRLDFGSLASATVGSMYSTFNGTIDLSSTLVTLRQGTELTSSLEGFLTSTASGGLVLSTPVAPPPGNTIFKNVAFATTSSIGVLRVLNGARADFVGPFVFTLASNVDGSTGGTPSLRVETGGQAQVRFSSVLSLRGFPEVGPGATMAVSISGRVNVLGANSAFRIGSTGTATGGIGLVTVSGVSSAIVADNDIVLGTTAPVNPGIGELRLDSGGTVTARRIVMNNGLLGLSTSASVTVETLVNNGGNIRLGESSTLTFTGNTTHTLAGTLQNNDTGFGGLLKINAGTLVVPESVGGFFNGTVRVAPNATLFPTRASLQTATVHLEPGSSLNLSQLVPSDALRFGALAGDNPLTLSNRVLELAASGTSATYSGRLATSGVRKIGSGTQTFTGGTVAEPITLPFFTVSAGTLRLSGAQVSLTTANVLPAVEGPLTISNPDTLLLVDAGAQLTTFSRPRITNNATLRVSGTGTAYNILKGQSGEAVLIVGGNAGGKLEVMDGASFSATNILLGSFNQGPEVVSSARVAGGAHLSLLDYLQFESPFSTFTVDSATATVTAIFHRTATGGGNLVLSDPVGGAHALVVGSAVNPYDIDYFGNIGDGPSGPGSIRFLGNVVRSWNPATNTLSGRLTVESGTLRISNQAVFAPNVLELNTPNALDVSAISNRPGKDLQIGHLAGSAEFSPLDFRDLYLGRNVNTLSADEYSGHLTTSTTQRIIKVGNSMQSFNRATIDSPSLLVVQGSVLLRNTTANLTATGSTGFAGNSSLFVETGSSLQIAENSVVNAVGSVQVHNTGWLFVNSGSSLAVNRSGNVRAQLRIGYAGGSSLMSVTSGASVTSQDSVEVGSQYAPNPGIGRLNISNATLTAPVLNFKNSASEVNLFANPALGGPTTLNIATLFSDPLAPNTSFTLSGSSTVNLIDPARFPIASAFTLPTSTYTGRITGLGTINTSVPLLDLALAPTMAGAINVTAGTLRIRQGQTLTGIGPTINLTGGTLDLGAPNFIQTVVSTSAVFGAGGGYLVDLVTNPSTSTSPMSDFLALNSLLALTATPEDPFIISIRSLSADGIAGPLTNFNPAIPFTIPIVTTTGGVAVLNLNAILLDTTGFQNPYAGTFSFRTDPTSLSLVYIPGVIPEPAALSLLALPAVALTRRRRRSDPTKSPSLPSWPACTMSGDGSGSSHVSESRNFND